MDKLKPCPFCGEKNNFKIVDYIEGEDSDEPIAVTKIVCGLCEAQIRGYLTKEMAIRVWNRRADNDR